MEHTDADLIDGQSAHSPPGTTLKVLYWLLTLSLVYTVYFAKTLLVPIVVALMLTLLLGPLVEFFRRFYIPRAVSAIILLCMIGGPFALLTVNLIEPAQKWAQRIPEFTTQLNEQMDALQSALQAEDPAREVQEIEESSGGIFSRIFGSSDDDDESGEEQETRNPLSDSLTQGSIQLVIYVLSATPVFLAQLITCVTLTIFLLVFGSQLFNAAITHLPQVRNKAGARHLVNTVQVELSRYILTVSVINALLGLITATVLWLLGVEDALLWGVLVGLLNFAPYIGTIIGIVVLMVAGLVQYSFEWFALMPALVYFIINGIEAQFVTPTVLGRHMHLNPLILMTWLIICAWLWGVIGVLLAVPLLVCIKLALSELEVAPHWVRVLETHG